MSKQNNDLGEPTKFDPNFDGPLKHRSCTDILCLSIFIVFVAAWIGVGLYAITNGDPSMLLVPKDSYGRRCGKDYEVSEKPNLFFFDLTKCLNPSVPFTGCQTPQVCVKECPSRDYLDGTTSALNDTERAEYCTSEGVCPSWFLKSSPVLNRCLYNVGERKKIRNKKISNIPTDEISTMKDYLKPIRIWTTMAAQNSIAFFTKDQKIIQKRCIPQMNNPNLDILKEVHMSVDTLTSAINNIKLLAQAEEVGQNVVEDILQIWWKILIGVLLALVVCIIYILILRWVAAPMVWLSIFGVLAALGAGIYFTTIKYIDFRDRAKAEVYEENKSSLNTQRDLWMAGMIILSIVTGIILLMLIFLRSRITLAIALIKEGSKAVSSVTASLFFPILPWILQLGVIAYAIVVALYLTSTGEPLYKTRYVSTACQQSLNIQDDAVCVPKIFFETISNSTIPNIANICLNATCKFIKMQNEVIYPYLQFYNVFGFFWLVFFVSAFGQMVLAAIFAQWYWTWNKHTLQFFAVTSATIRTLRYHIGTLAFGSLIIAICRMIRVCLEYLDQKLKQYDNAFTKAIMCCMKCFFYCLEKFLKFINKNAYIMCAIHGRNFCMSAKDAFMLLMRNIVRVFVLDKVTDFLFFLSKLLLTLGVGAVCYLVFVTDLLPNIIDNSTLNYRVVPVILIMICTYLISSLFFSVYSMAVDTLFLCFLEDCERNDGSQERPYYMSKNLMKIFGRRNKFKTN